MKFWKLHGIGNDFVAIDGRYDNIDNNDYGEYAKRACHRKVFCGGRWSIGRKKFRCCRRRDGLFINSDGSRADYVWKWP